MCYVNALHYVAIVHNKVSRLASSTHGRSIRRRLITYMHRQRRPLRHIRHWISRKPLEIKAWFQKTTNRKWPMGNQMVTWLMTGWRHSRDPEKSRSWPQCAYRAQYLENSWSCYLATIANYYPVCCEAVLSAILATAWLLVCFWLRVLD